MFFNRIAQETSSVHDSAYVRDGNGEKESLIKLARQAMGEMDQDEQAKLEHQRADDKAEVSHNPAHSNARRLCIHVRAFIQLTYLVRVMSRMRFRAFIFNAYSDCPM